MLDLCSILTHINIILKFSIFRMSRRFSRVESACDLFEFLDRGHSASEENRWTFEVAWEAANKGE